MSLFDLDYRVFTLPLEQPFTIARGTKNDVQNVIVTVTADDITGYGEAAPNERYDENASKVCQFLDHIPETYLDDIASPEELSAQLDQAEQDFSHSMKSAKSAVETAYLDWWGKSRDQPLWRLWNTPSNKTPSTSYTIGLDTVDVMQQKVKDAEEYPILKIKLGTDRDWDIIKAIREVTDKPIRVDANEGWETIEEAKRHIAFLSKHNIELVEQPMPAGTKKQLLMELKQWSPLPLMADESFKGEEDLVDIASCFDGINIKLAKIGSLVKARKVIKQAREAGISVMIGCMIESSLGISAGALLGTWADYVDLDGSLLIKDNPFTGMAFNADKQVVLNSKPGLGIAPKRKKT